MNPVYLDTVGLIALWDEDDVANVVTSGCFDRSPGDNAASGSACPRRAPPRSTPPWLSRALPGPPPECSRTPSRSANAGCRQCTLRPLAQRHCTERLHMNVVMMTDERNEPGDLFTFDVARQHLLHALEPRLRKPRGVPVQLLALVDGRWSTCSRAWGRVPGVITVILMPPCRLRVEPSAAL